jgi:hypothetical protein
MKQGRCALCLKDKMIVESHCISAGIYRRLGQDAVVMTPEIFLTTSRQVKDYLLCQGCEQMFGDAEDYAIPLLFESQRQTFPLFSKLRTVTASGRGRVAASAAGIDIAKLVYFALSIFWRASVKVWTSLNRQTISMPMMEYEEPTRKFLHGESEFPPEFILRIAVCTDTLSRGFVFAPVLWTNDRFAGYGTFLLGVDFTLIVNGPLDAQTLNLCAARTGDVSRGLFRDHGRSLSEY